MLVLGRTAQEAIHIGKDVVVHILKIKGNKVVVGIEAPDEIPVHRREIFLAIKAEEAIEADFAAEAAAIAELDAAEGKEDPPTSE